MVDTNLERAALAAIAAQPEKRVLPLTYENKCYYIKRRLANGRNAFAKSGTALERIDRSQGAENGIKAQ